MVQRSRALSLDGIRGLALAAPIAVHLGLVGSSRGLWLSISMFFVLSGFLVTTLALDEIERSGRLAVRKFWMRRVRRLLPASLLVLSLTMVVAVLVDWPGLTALRRDVLAALFWLANWEQLSGSGYWDNFAPSLTRHFWSLSFEEQVYIAFPLFVGAMVVASRSMFRGKRESPSMRVSTASSRTTLGLSLALGSTVLVAGSWWLLWTNDDASFLYLSTWTRLGEIAFGMIAAGLGRAFPTPRLSPRRASIVIVSAMSVAAPCWVFAAGDTVAGVRWGITIATPATALVIAMLWRHPQSLPSRIFSRRVPAWLGRRAYGIYLLHLPIIEFMVFVLKVDRLPWMWMIAAVGATIAGAGVMFRWFEEPLRIGAWIPSGRRVIVASSVAMALVAGGAFAVVVVDDGFRVDVVGAPPADIDTGIPSPDTDTGIGIDTGIDTGIDGDAPIPSDDVPSGVRRVALVVGDSTAWVTEGAVRAALAPVEWSSFSVHMVGCPFGGDVRLKSSIQGGRVTVRERGDEPGCDLWWDSLLGDWQRATRPSLIVIVGGYALAYEIDPQDDDGWCRLADGSGRCEAWAKKRLAALTERLRIESPNATIVWATPGHIDPYGPLDIPGEAIDVLDSLIRAEAGRHGDPVIELGAWLDDHLHLTVDGTHIGPEGVRALVPWMVDNLLPIVPR